jgi:hypothetical protein
MDEETKALVQEYVHNNIDTFIIAASPRFRD